MNAIMVMANSKRALEEVKRWIGRLDATTGRTMQTFVYTVENSTVLGIEEHYGAYASIHGQLQGVPDGAQVVLKIRK